MKYTKTVIAVFTVMLIIIAAALTIDIKKDISGISPADSVEITVDNGESGISVINKLHKNGIIKYPMFFKMKAKSSGYITQFKPGNAVFESGMSYDDCMRLLASNNRNMIKVTIPEGYEIRQIAELFAEKGLFTEKDFYTAANEKTYSYRFLEDIPDRENRLEGYLFPNTYMISETASAHDVINMMLAEFDKTFTDEYYTRAAELDMTVDEIVTLASIIERETNIPQERAKVAGVFYNRLNIGMKLQSCATVQYVLKERKTNLTNADISIDSKYNTYKYSGLPMGPIASAGAECIKAALYPEDTTAKYFVLGSDGKHIFSDTYQQHLNAKSKS